MKRIFLLLATNVAILLVLSVGMRLLGLDQMLDERGGINLNSLLIFSAVSWAIIFAKAAQYRRADRETATFLQVFRKSTKFSEVQSICPSVPASPLVGIFQAGYAELNLQLRRDPPPKDPDGRPAAAAARPTLKSLESVDRALLRATTVEVAKLEKRVPFLATTASITPTSAGPGPR